MCDWDAYLGRYAARLHIYLLDVYLLIFLFCFSHLFEHPLDSVESAMSPKATARIYEPFYEHNNSVRMSSLEGENV